METISLIKVPKNTEKHGKIHVIVSFDRVTKEPGFFKCQIWIPRRKTLRVGPVTKHSGTVKEKSQLSLYYYIVVEAVMA